LKAVQALAVNPPKAAADKLALVTGARGVTGKRVTLLEPLVLLGLAQAAESRTLSRLEALVRAESPSHDKVAVDRASSLVVAWAETVGGHVRRYRHPAHGDSLLITFSRRRQGHAPKQAPVLLLGHLDTVWPAGTLATMPYRVSRERITGPGVLDMKGGVAMAMSAIELLLAAGPLSQPVALLLHGDEEIGSPASRYITETVAKHCCAVFVLEPGQGARGAYKTARKGVGQYRLQVKGVASHSGVDFESGHSAVLELAAQLGRVAGLTDLGRGLTVNPGVIGGGTLPNVVAAEAWAEIDVRVVMSRDAERIDRQLRRLRPLDKACQLTVTGGLNRPPMERSRAAATLYRRARGLAAGMGFKLEEAATGGGSDGNFTAALGVPTLDGMGAVGAGAHAAQEHLLRAHLAPRTALLAAMLQQG
jgi:glutamate carboxypeptidase